MTYKKPSKKVSLKNLVLRGATWWFRRRRAGAAGKITEEYFSLDTRDLHEALAKRDAHLAGLSPRARAATPAAVAARPFATIAQIVYAYRDHRCKGEVRENTRRVNAQCLVNFARRAFATDTDGALAITLDRIDERAVRRYQESFFSAANAANPVASGVATTNANSILLKARSVFAHPEAFAALRVPEITAFRTVKPLDDKNFKKRIAFRPLTQDEGKKLLEGLAALKKSHPRLYLFASLMFRCGLRNSEAGNIMIDWITATTGGAPAVAIEVRERFVPKTPSSCRLVAIPPDLFDDLRAITGFTFTTDEANRILATLPKDPVEREKALSALYLTTPGLTPHRRTDFSTRDINTWLQSILPDREAYDLRKQAGSMMAHAFGDIREAQKLLGHASQTTTETYYAKSLTSLKLAPIAFAEA